MHNYSNGNELRILMQIKLISLTIVEHQDSLRNRDKQQLGNGRLSMCVCMNVTWIANSGMSTAAPLACADELRLFRPKACSPDEDSPEAKALRSMIPINDTIKQPYDKERECHLLIFRK